MLAQYWTAFALTRKSYRTGLLFAHRNGCLRHRRSKPNLVPRGRDPFGQRRGFFQRMTKGTPGDEVALNRLLYKWFRRVPGPAATQAKER